MKRKESQNAKWIKTWWLVVFLAGILLAQLFGNWYATDNLLDAYHLTHFAGQGWDWKELFWSIVWTRGRFFFVLFLLCATSFRQILIKALPPVLLFLIGVYAGVCLYSQGILGIGIFFFSIFPHYAIYLVLFFMILHKKKPIQYSGKRYVFAEIASVFFLVLIFLAGCLIEAAAGNFLLRHYLLAFISAIS